MFTKDDYFIQIKDGMSYFRPADGIFQGVIRDMINNGKNASISITASCDTQYKKESILDLDSDNYWVSQEDNNYSQYIGIELKDRFVSLTHISFRSPSSGYPKSWDFLASADGSSWDTLFSKTNSDILSKDKGVTLKAKNKVYRFFKVVNKGQSAGTAYTTKLRVTALEVFGVVTPCFQNCQGDIPAFKRVPNIFLTCKRKQVNTGHMLMLVVTIANK